MVYVILRHVKDILFLLPQYQLHGICEYNLGVHKYGRSIRPPGGIPAWGRLRP